MRRTGGATHSFYPESRAHFTSELYSLAIGMTVGIPEAKSATATTCLNLQILKDIPGSFLSLPICPCRPDSVFIPTTYRILEKLVGGVGVM